MQSQIINRVAQTGLVAKGVVYLLLGLLAFMAAFELGGHGNKEATQTGALQFVKDLPAGEVILIAVVIGLLCYSYWRGMQAYHTNSDKKGWGKRLRYIFSGLAYLAFAYTAIRVAGGDHSTGDSNQDVARELLSKPLGQVLVWLFALILTAVGAYQIYYGLSEKYQKHVQHLSLHTEHATLLLRSGKVGYISRGIVWLVIAFLFIRAAISATASEAGNTGKAFQFIESTPYGSPLLGVLGAGLMAYGIFNFVRARYEKFS